MLERVLNEQFGDRALRLTGGRPLLVEELGRDVVAGTKGTSDAKTVLDRVPLEKSSLHVMRRICTR